MAPTPKISTGIESGSISTGPSRPPRFKPTVTGSPLLGEHSDDVLAELGYTKEQIAAMHAKEII
jgi:crotonobetainyl-CoA:carnitine CoA-transferase CaiB-like acyl-CoA transferase